VTAGAVSAHMRGMESLTANPAALPTPDVNTRLASAQDPSTDSQALWQLIDDHNDLVANTARGRLRLALRPVRPVHVVHIPVVDPTTGLVVQP
jgi:hypothetical protein